MRGLLTLPVVGLLYAFSVLPMGVLYRFSDLLFVILYHVVGYRKPIVMGNLRHSFPDKEQEERQRIARTYYQHLCDLMVEIVKALTISRKEIIRRCEIVDQHILDEYAAQGRSVVAVLGHYGNWEWAALSASCQLKQQTVITYKKLSNPRIDRLFIRMRTRFGAAVAAMEHIARYYVEHKQEVFVSCFVADQSPTKISLAHWLTFLHQPTAVQMGPERFAKKYDHPLVFVAMEKRKRGYYAIRLQKLIEAPQGKEALAITQAHVRALEEQILREPAYWMWSHRRWKRKPPTPAPVPPAPKE